MVCPNCNKNIEDDMNFCPYCGSNINKDSKNYQPMADINGESNKFFTKSFSLNSFLVLMIVASVTVVLTSAPLLLLLFVIAGWIIFSAAKGNKTINYKVPLKMMWGVVSAHYIINWILIVLFSLSGVGLAFLAANISGKEALITDSEVYNEIFAEISASYGQQVADIFLNIENISLMLFLFSIILIVVAAIFTVVNICAFRSMRKCAASAVNSYMFGHLLIEKLNTVKTWLLVLGILDSVTLLTLFNADWFSIICGLCNVAVYIFAYLWIKDVIIEYKAFENSSRQTEKI